MIDACDPDADMETLRRLIKLNTGDNLTLTKKEMCQVYDEIQDGKLPLPPLIMSSNRTYLIDKKSPLKPGDYDILFDSSSKRSDLKRIARKVGIKRLEQLTKIQIIDAIGKRMRYMNIHEPVKFARRQTKTSPPMNFNNTAVNNVATNNVAANNTAVNNNANLLNNGSNNNGFNNNGFNNNGFNNNGFKNNGFNNNGFKNNGNQPKKLNMKPNFLSKTNRGGNNSEGPRFPKNGVYVRNERPKFLGGTKRATSKRYNSYNNYDNYNNKPGFMSRFFGKKKDSEFIPSNKFTGEKKGYVFKTDVKGIGYYKNTARPVQGPEREPFKPIFSNVPNVTNANNALKKKIQNLENKLASKNNNIRNIETKLENAKKNAENKIAEAKNEGSRKAEEIAISAKKKVEDLERQQFALQSTLTTTRNSLENLERQKNANIAAITRQKNNAENKIRNIQNKLENAQKNVQNKIALAKAEGTAEAQKNVNNAKREVENLKATLNSTRQEKNAAIENIRTQLQNAQKNVENKIARAKAEGTTEAQRNVNNAKREVENLKVSLMTTSQQKNNLIRNLQEKNVNLNTLRNNLKMAQNNASRKEQEIIEAKSNINRVRLEAERAANELKNELTREKNQKQQDINKAREEVRVLTQQAANEQTAEARRIANNAKRNYDKLVNDTAKNKQLKNKQIQLSTLSADSGVNFSNKISSLTNLANASILEKEIMNAKNTAKQNQILKNIEFKNLRNKLNQEKLERQKELQNAQRETQLLVQRAKNSKNIEAKRIAEEAQRELQVLKNESQKYRMLENRRQELRALSATVFTNDFGNRILGIQTLEAANALEANIRKAKKDAENNLERQIQKKEAFASLNAAININELRRAYIMGVKKFHPNKGGNKFNFVNFKDYYDAKTRAFEKSAANKAAANKALKNEEAAVASKKLVNNALTKVKLNAEKNRLKKLVKNSKLNTNPFWGIEINALTNVNKGKNIEKKIRNKALEATNSIENKKKETHDKAKNFLKGGIYRFSNWKRGIDGARTSQELNAISSELNKRRNFINRVESNTREYGEFPGSERSVKQILKNHARQYKRTLTSLENRFNAVPRQKALANKMKEKRLTGFKEQYYNSNTINKLNKLEKDINDLISKQPKKVPMGNFKTYNNPLAKNNKIPGAKPNPAFTMETLPPAPPKRSFKNVGRQTVTNVKMQGIRNAANIAKKQKAIREAQGAERVKLARDLAAEQTKRGGSNKTKRAADVMRPVPRPGAVIKSGSSPLTNEDRRSGISSINKLQKLPQPLRTVYKGQIKRAETKAGLDAIVQRATIESKKTT